MDKRDLALQLSCPVISMPIYSLLPPLEQNGERVIIGRNGTFLEVLRPWARIVTLVGPALATTVPFGSVGEVVEYTAGKLPRTLLAEFVEWAKQDSAVEIGAVITWNETTGEYLLRRSKSNHATSGSLDYELPQLAEGEHIVVDCHSHSHHPAYFSKVDDQDDCHAVKFALVVGNCDRANQTTMTRLCVRGVFKKMNWII
jgi:PRTRC genetic system protein A